MMTTFFRILGYELSVFFILYGAISSYFKWRKLQKAYEAIEKDRKIQEEYITPHVPDTGEFRVAVHEAGHAIAAWWCTAVSKFVEMTVDDPGGGHVSATFQYDDRNDADTEWCKLVFTLAGIAAESIIYPNINAFSSRKDLMQARDIASWLASLKKHNAPWIMQHDASSIPFKKIYIEDLPEAEEKILRQAYIFAKEIVRHHMDGHKKLVVSVIANRTIREADIIKMFGNRAFIKAGGRVKAMFIMRRLSPREQA